MRRAVRGWPERPTTCSLTALCVRRRHASHTCFVKGDAKIASISRSILAKTHRDTYMLDAAQTYPGYGWETNMGYPVAHRQALVERGPTPCTAKRSPGRHRPPRCLTERLYDRLYRVISKAYVKPL